MVKRAYTAYVLLESFLESFDLDDLVFLWHLHLLRQFPLHLSRKRLIEFLDAEVRLLHSLFVLQYRRQPLDLHRLSITTEYISQLSHALLTPYMHPRCLRLSDTEPHAEQLCVLVHSMTLPQGMESTLIVAQILYLPSKGVSKLTISPWLSSRATENSHSGIPGIHVTLNSRWEFQGIFAFLWNSTGNLREFDRIANFKQKVTKFKLSQQ